MKFNRRCEHPTTSSAKRIIYDSLELNLVNWGCFFTDKFAVSQSDARISVAYITVVSDWQVSWNAALDLKDGHTIHQFYGELLRKLEILKPLHIIIIT